MNARPLHTLLVAVPLLFALPILADDVDVSRLVGEQDVDSLRAMGPGVVPELVALYRQGDPDERANLAWILYHLGWKSEEAKRALMEDVHTEHDSLRIWSQYALGRVSNDDEVVDVLFENMKRGDRWLFRDKAACSLAYDQIHLSEPQKIRLYSLLIAALNDDDRGTRDLAIRVLEVHTGQRKGYHPAASPRERAARAETWWRWLKEYRASVAALEEN